MSDQIGSASIRLAVDATGVDAGMNRVEATVTRATRSLNTLGNTGSAAINNMGSGAQGAANNVDRATRAIQNSIQRVIATTEAGERGSRSFYESLANQRGANLNTLRPYLDQLELVRTRQREAAEAALRGGQAYQSQAQSAAQLAAGLRGVPAQLTDIVTSIQGGQQPLTVLLQQGGQLRDMFGSAGGAASALGGYLKSLITPYTAVAAAVAVLAVAYNQGSKENDAFRKAIVLSGNAAGVTTSQLANMAKQASAASGTVGANAEALAQLVGTGKVAAADLVRFSTTAVESQKYLGIAVTDTAKAFADLGKDPLQATLKLGDQYGYLTAATYQQIKALELQGRTSDAAKVAQSAFADAMDKNNKTVATSLGTLQRAWNATGEEARRAWDYMLGVGRPKTIDDQITSARVRLDQAQRGFQAMAMPSSAGFSTSLGFSQTQAEASARVDLQRLENQKKAEEQAAKNAAEDKKRNDASIKFDEESEKYLTRREKMEREIAAARNLGMQAAPRGQDAAVTEEAIQKRIALIRQSYADINNASIESQIAAVTRLGAVQEEAAKRALIPIQANQDAGLNKALDQQVAYRQKIAAADEAALVRERDGIRQRMALTSQEVVSDDQRAQQQAKLAEMRGQIALKDQQILTRRAELSKDLFVLDVQNNRAIFESQDRSLQARQDDVDALEKQVQAQKDENAVLGMTTEQLRAHTDRMVEDRASRLETDAAIKDTILGLEAEADSMRKAADRMRELNKERNEGADKKKAIDANKSFWESVDKTAQSAFTAIFEGGKSVSDRLRDAFKAGILDVLYQLTVKKWIIDISTSSSGSSIGSSLGALANGSGGGAGGSSLFGTATNLFSAGKMIYQGFSTGIAASLGGQITTLGNLFGSQAVSAFGTGMSLTTSQAASAASAYSAAGNATAAGGLSAGASAASAIPIIGWIIAGMAANDGFYKQGYRIDGQRGDITRELLQSTLKGNILGPIGATATVGIGAGDSLLRKLGLDSRTASLLSGSSLWTKAFGLKAPTIESQGIQGTIDASGVTGESFANILQKGGWFRSDKRSVSTVALDGDTDAGFDKTVKAMISAVKGFGGAIGEQTTAIDGYSKQFKLTLTGDATKDQAALNALFTGVGDDLATILVPSIKSLTNEGETAAAALQRLAGDYVTVDSALSAIGIKFGAVGASSLAARESLVALTGGIDAFSGKAEFFSQNFLSEAERVSAVRKQLDAGFAELGLTSVPKTRDEFKALVQGLDLTTDKGRQTYASLMGLQEAFAQVVPYIDETAKAAEAASLALTQQKQQRALDIQLMQALGNEEGALAATRADALAALQTDQAKLTQQQIYQAQDAKTALEATKAADLAYQAMMQNMKDSARQANATVAAALGASIQRAQDAAVAFGKLNDALLVGESSTLNAAQKYEATKRSFASANSSNLEGAEKALLDSSKAANGEKSLQYARDFAAVMERNRLESLSQAAAAESIARLLRGFLDENIGKYANGGVASGLSLVGENGPELVDFRSSARVYTAQDTRGLLAPREAAIPAEIMEFLRALMAQVILGNGYNKQAADVLMRASRDGTSFYVKVEATTV